jgi:hypothetical protein
MFPRVGLAAFCAFLLGFCTAHLAAAQFPAPPADGACITEAMVQSFIAQHEGAHEAERLTGQRAKHLLALYNSMPPVTSDVGDRIITYERGPDDQILFTLWQGECLSAKYFFSHETWRDLKAALGEIET